MTHEIGHLFGMKHCVFYNCVLNGCNNFEEFDSKPLYMCPVCIRKLQSNIEFNFVDHYEGVAKACEEIGGDTGLYSKFFAKAANNIRDAYGEWYK
jgi:archaemetzincin